MLKRLTAILLFHLITWGTLLPQNIPFVIDLSVNQKSAVKIVMVKLQLLTSDRKNLWQYYADSLSLNYDTNNRCKMSDTARFGGNLSGSYTLKLFFRYSLSKTDSAEYSFATIDSLPFLGVQIFVDHRVYAASDYQLKITSRDKNYFLIESERKSHVSSMEKPIVAITYEAKHSDIYLAPVNFFDSYGIRPAGILRNLSEDNLSTQYSPELGILDLLIDSTAWLQYKFAALCGTGMYWGEVSPERELIIHEGFAMGDVQALIPAFYRFGTLPLKRKNEETSYLFYFRILY